MAFSLLVSVGGYPLAYSIHEGNKYEGHTMLPIVEDFAKQFELKDFVVVADSGLMNNDNITLLEQKKLLLSAKPRKWSKHHPQTPIKRYLCLFLKKPSPPTQKGVNIGRF